MTPHASNALPTNTSIMDNVLKVVRMKLMNLKTFVRIARPIAKYVIVIVSAMNAMRITFYLVVPVLMTVERVNMSKKDNATTVMITAMNVTTIPHV
jgi:hypothetical protein